MNNQDRREYRKPKGYFSSGATPESIAAYIGFQLSELSAKNGHHEFEHLCTHLARKRICPNILPSTGPVSGGGDQGADSETYSVLFDGEEREFFSAASKDKVAFACSLAKNVKKKVEADLKLATSLPHRPSKLYFFTNQLVQVAIRHKLQRHANDAYGIHLEIFDRRALSELLADREVFWIAQKYLSIPSELMPPLPDSESGWYARILESKDTGLLSEFIDLKYAIRNATFTDSLHSDIPCLVERLKKFLNYPLGRIQRKAFYEIFVASLRGLESARGYENDLHQYFSEISQLYDAAELEDVAVLLQYCHGAEIRGLLTLRSGLIDIWRGQLLETLTKLLQAAADPSRKCQLMMEISMMEILGELRSGNLVELKDALATWNSMLKLIPDAPMYPLERFTDVLSELVVPFGENLEYRKVLSRFECILSGRVGRAKVARLAVARATKLYEAGKNLKAIEELHAAKIDFFAKETVCEAVIVSIFLAQLYETLGLFAAAQLYAMSAAYATLKIDEDKLRRFAAIALLEVITATSNLGSSLETLMIARPACFMASQYGVAGCKEQQDEFWAVAQYHLVSLTYISQSVATSLQNYIIDRFIKQLGLEEAYATSIPDLRKTPDFESLQTIVKAAEKKNIAVPFSDIATTRRIRWCQLGIEWEITWQQTFENNIAGEMLAAYLQILLADVVGVELSLMPTKALIELTVGGERTRTEQRPSNEVVSLKVTLSKTTIRDAAYLDYQEAAEVSAEALSMMSALADEDFKSRFQQRLTAGLIQKMGIFAPYEVAYKEFFEEDDFKDLWEVARSIEKPVPIRAIETDECLDGPTGIHPLYDANDTKRVISNRYRISLQHARPILDRYLNEASFVAALKQLKSEGWKDWHLLMAILNIQFTHRVNKVQHPAQEMQKITEMVFARDMNTVEDIAPVSAFNVEHLRIVSKMSQLSTLKGLGLGHRQATPNFNGVNILLNRFRYWEDDIPHDDPFEGRLN